MKTLIKLTAVLMLCTSPALAGKGGSNGRIVSAVQSGSVDAIIAEVERAEALMCPECVTTVTALTEDNRYEIRQVAGWWFAKRPAIKDVLAQQFVDDLANGSSLKVRNAADFLGTVRQYTALPALRATIKRAGLSAEAKLAVVRAAATMAHVGGNPILTTAMTDSEASVRAAAITAWRDVLGQVNAAPVVNLLTDSDANVRAQAAIVVGAYGELSARAALEKIVTSDSDVWARRNAAWALGQIGSEESRAALTAATADKSGIVKGVAKAALASLH